MHPTTQRLYTSRFVTMAVANFFVLTSFGTFYLFPLFITSQGGTGADIGIIMGIIGLSSVLCRPWIARLIDRIGRKKSYTLACVLMGFMPLCYLPLRGPLDAFYGPLMAIRIVHGVVLALYFTSGFTYIVDFIPFARLNEGIGMFGGSGLAGMALGPVIAELIITAAGFHHLFFAASAMVVVSILIHLPLPETGASNPDRAGIPFFSVLRGRKMYSVLLLSLLFGLGIAASSNFVAPYGRQRGIAVVSIFYLCYSGSAIFTRLFGGTIADRVGEGRVLPYSLILTGGGFLCLTFLDSTLELVAAGLMTGCGTGFLYPAIHAIAIREGPRQTERNDHRRVHRRDRRGGVDRFHSTGLHRGSCGVHRAVLRRRRRHVRGPLGIPSPRASRMIHHPSEPDQLVGPASQSEALGVLQLERPVDIRIQSPELVFPAPGIGGDGAAGKRLLFVYEIHRRLIDRNRVPWTRGSRCFAPPGRRCGGCSRMREIHP